MNAHWLFRQLERRSRFIQGKSVFSEVDVASLYGLSIPRLRQSIRRNIIRFPAETLFKLADQSYAFTQEGVLLVCSILKTPQAIQIHIEIIRELFAFNSN